MSWIADAHREWHTVHGAKEVCPLDCGAGEDRYDDFGNDEEAYEAAKVAGGVPVPEVPIDWPDSPF